MPLSFLRSSADARLMSICAALACATWIGCAEVAKTGAKARNAAIRSVFSFASVKTGQTEPSTKLDQQFKTDGLSQPPESKKRLLEPWCFRRPPVGEHKVPAVLKTNSTHDDFSPLQRLFAGECLKRGERPTVGRFKTVDG